MLIPRVPSSGRNKLRKMLRKRFGQDLRNYLLMHAAFKKMIAAELHLIHMSIGRFMGW